MASVKPQGTATAQDIESLRKRYTELDRRKAAAEANLKTANDELERRKAEAMEQYGTDDVDQLKAKLAAMKEENERRRQEYQTHLQAIEARLGDVERQHVESRKG